MKTLVTGATGFVGSAVVRKLINAGHDVRVLVRSKSNRRNLDGLTVEIKEGDLCDTQSLKSAVAGCDNLFHVAADYRLWVRDPEVMYNININGTQALILAAAEAGIKRIVYTSSVATLGLNQDKSSASEDTPSSLAAMTGHYKRSKFLAEQAVQQLIEQHKLPVVIVNPSTPIGPRDIKPTPTGRIILDTIRGRMPAYVDTGLNVAHVDDIARGHLMAYEHGKAGERYILGGEDMTLLQILEMIDEITGKRSKRIRLSHNLVLPIAWAMEKIATITGKEPRATLDSVRMSKKHMYFSSDKAIRDLGYQHRPAREAIRDAIDWFRQSGYCE
ncbi:MAG: NAD-dependent dehydratase [Gammaproteobacteria bacterium]|nr:NAD-dependent dehydratase [Gammaproteobacteria bacterium]